ncbi:Maf family protein [Pseudoroseicyclus tamaricis]|uniref:Nucleoside triphosphate pyrophosphatase n=1 Tax=Pseudoroseicyclus tamaricis TaxID=2705421 RepID=A0A6B2K1D6_9RHOB|nr:Maf family nucleotide pyrophosphatase [Pseudoroseicyclus tamaricis]NDV02779.1 septum formation protein Maf [Pseudoroseicyclus tamaricis]
MSSTALILASGSATRAALLTQVRLPFEVSPARVDEAAIRASLAADGAAPRDVADALAEAKARKASGRHPDRLVLGSDQVLVHDREILAKPESREQAAAQLARLAGQTHDLLSAAVLYEGGAPVWRHITRARLTMHALTPAEIEEYLSRTWPGVADSVGGYKIEEEGLALFSNIEGDQATILGLPLLPLLSYLRLRGTVRA